MIIGVPKELKTLEYRVGLVPSSVEELVAHGHSVLIEKNAGTAINFNDQSYRDAGAKIIGSAQDIYRSAELIVKIKEPQPHECHWLQEGQILFTFLHLAANPKIADLLQQSGCIAIAYETVTDSTGRTLPLLKPMSEIAGRLSVQVGAYHMMKHNGGSGRLICGTPDVKPAHVLIVGGGVAGINAAQIAAGMNANVTILEKSNSRLNFLNTHFQNHKNVVCSNANTIEMLLPDTDLLIGAALVPGASAPKILHKEALHSLRPGTVLVDIAIDQGGCFETSRPTTHDKPTFIIDNIVHYCVTNMPGAVPLTAALASNHVALPYVLALANHGWQAGIREIPGFESGLNVCKGDVVHQAVADALNKRA